MQRIHNYYHIYGIYLLMNTYRYLIFAIITAITTQLSGQIVINEYSASNLENYKDSFNKTEDWIEIYNSEDSDRDISGWYISDKDDNVEKWQFPTGTIIEPNGYLLVLCSGKDGIYNGEYHSNFKLTQTSGDDSIVLSDENGTVVDFQPLSLTLTDHSNCRHTDGSDEWMICTEPTVGLSNNNSAQAISYTATPSMSLQAGYYTGSQTIIITNNEPNSILRYTTDGSNPLSDSPIYDTPITINNTTVVKALSFSNDVDILPGKVEFNTYLIDENYSLPVFSVAADRVTNLANGAGVILPIGSIEYFKDNEFVTSSFGELNRHGQDSWALDHRSIDWISRDEMGYSKAVDAPIISSSNRDEYQRFMFRNSGDDNYPAIDDFEHEGSTHVRDEYVQTLAQEGGMELDLRKVERVVLFLNGQYWGVYGMREKVVDHDYTKEYYGQGKEDLQFLSTWGTTEIEYGGVEALIAWIQLRDFILDNDMSDPSNYKIIEDSLNLISLIDYFTMNQASVASDWLNYNTGWWRGLDPEGTHKKWAYMLWDLDATFDYYINYTGVPNTDPDASLCDIYQISDAIDQFFSSVSLGPCDLNGGNNSPYSDDDPIFEAVVGAVSSCCQDWDADCQGYYDDPNTIPNISDNPENCSSILDGNSPYPAEDSIFILVVQQEDNCCDEWGNACQDLYNTLSDYSSIIDCPIFIDNTSPYPPTDVILEAVIGSMPMCCDEWTQNCQDQYIALGGIDYEECFSIVNGSSPYPADDPYFQQVVNVLQFCCNEWFGVCENFYQRISENDILDCPVIINGTLPYEIDDPKLPFVISVNPDCCESWGVSCDRDYDLLGGDQFAEPDDPFMTGLTGNIGKHEKILLKLFDESPDFKQLYYSRYADMMNTVYTCENMTELLDRMIGVIEPEMPGQIERWGGTLNEWENNVEDLREFINERCLFLNDGAVECYNEIEGQYLVTLMSEPQGVGRIDFNTLKLDNLPWSGSYFGDMDNLAEAKVLDTFKNQYEFSHWESKMGNNISPNDTLQEVTYRLSMPDTLIAHYKLLSTTVANENIVINEFMASNDLTVLDQDGESEDWIELYNKGNDAVDISGYFLSDNAQNIAKYVIPDNTIMAADDYLIIWADEDGSQDGFHANFKLSKSGETIFLSDTDTSIIDQIAYTDQETDISFARKPNGIGAFRTSMPTFNAKNDGTSSTNNISIDDRLIVYPNPTTDKITIQLKRNGHAIEKVEIRDMLGKKVLSYTDIKENEMIIHVGHLVPGLYLITANQLYTTKVVVE